MVHKLPKKILTTAVIFNSLIDRFGLFPSFSVHNCVNANSLAEADCCTKGQESIILQAYSDFWNINKTVLVF